jgi:RNA polymerase sigma-70 factor (ECF subfamily)
VSVFEGPTVAFSDIDRSLLQRCLARRPRAWEDFVDRFMGLVIHVINHSAQCRSRRLTTEDREDLVAQVFLAIVRDDLALLRQFRGECSLATYLTVVARRVVVHEILKNKTSARLTNGMMVAAEFGGARGDAARDDEPRGAGSNGDTSVERRVSDREEVERLLAELDAAEAQVVRLYHLEGKSYQEISSAMGMPENSIGPTLSRARRKMRQADAGPTTG